MNIISALASGVRGAENGTARFYRRGTTVGVNPFSDFEANSSCPSNVVSLDALGAAVVYAPELVDVLVYDIDGTLVRKWTDGACAASVEVTSPAFTGSDYETALQSAGAPTNLAAALDLWKTQNGGAIDWKVTVNGLSQTLPLWLAGIAGLCFNVKAAKYGAVGNGVANDAAAIQAAETDAAAAGGGIVFFPPGTYYVGDTMLTRSTGSKTSWVGCGPDSSIIRGSGAAVLLDILSSTDAGANPELMSGIGFQFAAVSLNPVVRANGAQLCMVFERCCFGTSVYEAPMGFFMNSITNTSRVAFKNCVFPLRGAGHGISATGGVYCEALMVDGCWFKWFTADPSGAAIRVARAIITGCSFDARTVTAGTPKCISTTGITTPTSEDCLTVIGNRCSENGNGASSTPLVTALDTTCRVIEWGNDWANATLNVVRTAKLLNEFHPGILGARKGRLRETTDTSAPDLFLNAVEHYRVKVNISPGPMTLNVPSQPQFPGMEAFVSVVNHDSDTSINSITWTGYVDGNVPAAGGGAPIGTNRAKHYYLRSQESSETNATYWWVVVAESETADKY